MGLAVEVRHQNRGDVAAPYEWADLAISSASATTLAELGAHEQGSRIAVLISRDEARA